MRLFAALMALTIGCEASAQTGPSAEATSIALTAIPADNDRVVEKLAGDLTLRILAVSERDRSNPGCDTRLDACLKAAENIAKQAAPLVSSQRRKYTARLLAVAIDSMLTPEERRVAREFYDSSAGRKVALATFGIGDFRRLPPDAQMALYAELERPDQTTDNLTIPALAEKFRKTTLALPRAPTRDPQ